MSVPSCRLLFPSLWIYGSTFVIVVSACYCEASIGRSHAQYRDVSYAIAVATDSPISFPAHNHSSWPSTRRQYFLAQNTHHTKPRRASPSLAPHLTPHWGTTWLLHLRNVRRSAIRLILYILPPTSICSLSVSLTLQATCVWKRVMEDSRKLEKGLGLDDGHE